MIDLEKEIAGGSGGRKTIRKGTRRLDGFCPTRLWRHIQSVVVLGKSEMPDTDALHMIHLQLGRRD